MRRAVALLVVLLALSACSGGLPGVASASDLRARSWQEQITEVDRKRLAGLWAAWTRALNQATAAGETAAEAEASFHAAAARIVRSK